jgi:hypothetical protein
LADLKQSEVVEVVATVGWCPTRAWQADQSWGNLNQPTASESGVRQLAGRIPPTENAGSKFLEMWRFGAVATADALDLGLVVFDITGTVITNTGAVADAFLSALRTNGVQITEEELQPWRGASKRLAIRRLLECHSSAAPSEAQVEKVHGDFHDHLRHQFEAEGLQVIAGVRHIVGVLSGAHSRERLSQAPHTSIVGSVADLPGLWGCSS